MSDDERHSGVCELNSGADMVNNPESTKIKGGSKRMERKQEKPKRSYKKKNKPAAETVTEPGEKASRNRISKRNADATKKRTKPTKPSILEEAINSPAGRIIPGAYTLGDDGFYPCSARSIAYRKPTGLWCQPLGVVYDNDSDESGSDSDNDDDDMAPRPWIPQVHIAYIEQILSMIFEELKKHTPKN